MRQPYPDLPDGPWTVVHDFAFVIAGAERVTAVLANDVLDGAPVRVIGGSDDVMRAMDIRGGVERLLPKALVRPGSFRALTAAYPWLLGQLPPVEGNVLCSSYAFAHHVRCTGLKVVLCHTPLRQVWSDRDAYLAAAALGERAYIRMFEGLLRYADKRAAESAVAYIAVSRHVQQRLARHYGIRNSLVISPSVEPSFTRDDVLGREARSYFLWVGRITEPYKRLGVVIDAFRDSDHQLIVAGDGEDRGRLEAGAPSNVRFVGWQTQEQLGQLYRGAVAVIFPSKDDFGLVPVEATAAGTPTLAYSDGGALETVLPGRTGLLFGRQTPAAIRDVVAECLDRDWDYASIRASAARFSEFRFVRRLRWALATLAVESAGEELLAG